MAKLYSTQLDEYQIVVTAKNKKEAFKIIEEHVASIGEEDSKERMKEIKEEGLTEHKSKLMMVEL